MKPLEHRLHPVIDDLWNAEIHKQEEELHKMQWQPEILELIRYMVRMDIQNILGAKIKASAWRAVHK